MSHAATATRAALAALGLRAGGFDAAELRAAYRREALRVHPDKGGSAAVFRRLTAAYLELKRALRGGASPPAHHEARRESAEAHAAAAAAVAAAPGAGRPAAAAFNAAFERGRAPPSDGLGAWMAAEVPAARRCPARVSAKAFGAEFARVARRAPLALAVTAAPAAPSAGCTLGAAAAAGGGAPEPDYSSPASTAAARPPLAYCDLRAAHGGAVMDPAAADAAAVATGRALARRARRHKAASRG